MAGAMRKMAVYLGLVEDHGDDAYDEYEDYEAARKGSRESRTPPRGYDDRYDERPDDRYASRSVRPIPDTRAVRTFRSDGAAPSRPAGARAVQNQAGRHGADAVPDNPRERSDRSRHACWHDGSFFARLWEYCGSRYSAYEEGATDVRSPPPSRCARNGGREPRAARQPTCRCRPG